MLLFIGVIAVSCKKEAGPAGTNGTNGTNGNANVMVYGYGETVLNAGNSYYAYFYPDVLTPGLIDSSVITCYYSVGANEWNVANGYGPGAQYATIQYTGVGTQSYVGIYLKNPDGTTYSGADITWDSVRVFIIPANIFRSFKMENVDYNDYYSVNDYFSK